MSIVVDSLSWCPARLASLLEQRRRLLLGEEAVSTVVVRVTERNRLVPEGTLEPGRHTIGLGGRTPVVVDVHPSSCARWSESSCASRQATSFFLASTCLRAMSNIPCTMRIRTSMWSCIITLQCVELVIQVVGELVCVLLHCRLIPRGGEWANLHGEAVVEQRCQGTTPIVRLKLPMHNKKISPLG